MKVCLDTNAYSALYMPQEEGRGNRVQDALERADSIFIPIIVMGELMAGFKRGTREKDNLSTLDRFVQVTQAEILRVDLEVAEKYAFVFKQLKDKGNPIPTNDLWIAACCLNAGASLLTFDRHFAFVPGLVLIF